MSAPAPATYLALLQQAKLGYLTQLANLSSLAKPDYNVDGQGIQWMQYQMAIIERAISHLNVLIQVEGGPVAYDTTAVPGGGGGYVGP